MDGYLDDGSPEPMQDYPVQEDGREESMDMQGDKLDSGFHDKEGGEFVEGEWLVKSLFVGGVCVRIICVCLQEIMMRKRMKRFLLIFGRKHAG